VVNEDCSTADCRDDERADGVAGVRSGRRFGRVSWLADRLAFSRRCAGVDLRRQYLGPKQLQLDLDERARRRLTSASS